MSLILISVETSLHVECHCRAKWVEACTYETQREFSHSVQKIANGAVGIGLFVIHHK
jgi:hypothetical protein